MCFERLLTELHTIKEHVVTTTDQMKKNHHQSVVIRAVMRYHYLLIMNLNAINQTWALVYKNTPFLCRLRGIAAHRDHFVRRLSVRLCVCPVVTLSW